MYRKTRRVRRNKRRSTKRRSHRTRKMRGGGTCGMSQFAGTQPTVAVLPSAAGMPYNAAELAPKGTYHGFNPNVQDWAAPSNGMFGGRGRRKGKKTQYGKTKYGKTKYGKNQRGGGVTEFVTALLPQEIVNIGRSLPASLGHVYDTYKGDIPSASSMVYPTDQPLVKAIYPNVGTAPPDIASIYNQKNVLVSRI